MANALAKKSLLAALSLLVSLACACGDDDSGSSSSAGGSGGSSAGGSGGPGAGGAGGGVENTGQSCKAPADCYKSLSGGTIGGEVLCLDKFQNGYCTHECNTDADCCAVQGECKSGLKQVCSPFESTGKKMCFLSCEQGDIVPASTAGAGGSAGAAGQAGSAGSAGAVDDATAYCQREANVDFGCRSTGGGKENRKVCLP